MTTGRQQRFSVFMEGVQVPCVSVSITSRINHPAYATINLVPTDSSFYAPQRTLVHVFWRDLDGIDRLLFEGETVSKSFSYASGHRQASYRCRDLTQYWEHAHHLFFATFYLSDPKNQSISPDEFARFFNILNVEGAQQVDDAGTRVPQAGRSANVVSLSDLLTSAFNGTPSIGFALEAIFDHLAKVNSYWIFSDARVKLRRKVLAVDNPIVKSLLKTPAGIQFDFRVAPVDRASIWEILQIVTSRLYYHIVCNPAAWHSRTRPGSTAAPQSLDLSDPDEVKRGYGYLTNYVLMPNLYLSQPPRCNVLTPPLYSEFSFSDHFVSSPTRTVGLFGQYLDDVVYAPSTVGDDLGNLRANPPDRNFLTAEEQVRGFVPNIYHITPDEIKFAGTDRPDPERDRLLAHIVNYRHWLENYRPRMGQGMGPFNPYLVAGFPAAVIDRDFGYVLGLLQSVTHTLNFSGPGSTTTAFQLSLCRHASTSTARAGTSADDQARETVPPEGILPSSPGQPGWFDEGFSDDKIGATVYRPLLGYGSDGGGVIASKVGGGNETVAEALARIRTTVLEAGANRDRVAWDLVRRPLATQYATFLALGAEPSESAVLADIQGRKPSSDAEDDWPYLRRVRSGHYQNPGGMTQTIRAIEGTKEAEEVAGPFLKDRQDWAKAYRGETRREGLRT